MKLSDNYYAKVEVENDKKNAYNGNFDRFYQIN